MACARVDGAGEGGLPPACAAVTPGQVQAGRRAGRLPAAAGRARGAQRPLAAPLLRRGARAFHRRLRTVLMAAPDGVEHQDQRRTRSGSTYGLGKMDLMDIVNIFFNIRHNMLFFYLK